MTGNGGRTGRTSQFGGWKMVRGVGQAQVPKRSVIYIDRAATRAVPVATGPAGEPDPTPSPPMPRPSGAPAGWARDQVMHMPTPAYVCNKRGVIVAFNERAADLWGRTPDIGDARERYCGFIARFRRDGSALLRDHSPMAHALMTGRRVNDFELIGERPDRSRRTVLTSIGVLRDEQSAIIGAIGCMQDITTWKQMAESVRQAELLEGMQRVVREIAHSYSNILAATSSHLNMARRRSTEAQATKFIDGAIRSMDRGVDYTRGLSTFAREPQVVPDLGDLDGVLSRFALSETANAGERHEPVESSGEGKTVLIVDDDSSLRAVARDALSSLGYGVLDADGGETALEIVRSHRPLGLMVVDVGMVPMNGIEFLEHARAIRPDVKALMMTGHPDVPDDLTIGRSHTAVLRKPFGIDELAHNLSRLIS